jgi:hypothetical protein
MKKSITIFFVLLVPAIAYSQQEDTLWRYNLQTGLNFNQSSFNTHWIGGGINSISLGSFFNYLLQFEDDAAVWTNEIDLRYGITRNEGEMAKKTSDRVFFDSKYGRKLNDNWRVYGSLNFMTQFAPGYEFGEGGVREAKISDFMAPGYLTSSWGFEYQPVDYFWIRIGPFSPRLTFVLQEELQGNFGVDVGESIRYEWFAFQLVSGFNRALNDNLSLKARYEFFANYEEISFRQFEHRLELLFTSEVTRLINVSLGTMLIYDIDQIDGLQLSQALSVGLQYRLSTMRD